MDTAEKIKNWLENLRALPDKQKKIILWAIVGILLLTMGFFWIRGTMDKISNFKVTDVVNLDILNSPDKDFFEDQAVDWKIYTNSKYGIAISHPGDWNSGISILFPDVILFCPPELSSSDSYVICKIGEDSAGNVNPQSPIIFDLVKKEIKLTGDSNKYKAIFEKMKNSLEITK